MGGRSSPDYEALPFPVGTSPFRIKGTSYRGHLDYAEAQIPGGQAAIVFIIWGLTPSSSRWRFTCS